MDSVRVKVWINAFIPKDIPGLTKKVPDGPHEGKTMMHGPIQFVNDCFLTDQRDFDGSPSASSRMHSLVEVECVIPALVAESHRTDPTIEIDCEDGDEECYSQASTSGLRIENFSSESDDQNSVINFKFVGEVNNSCFTGAPDIDWNIDVTIEYVPEEKVAIKARGLTDPFPAYEMYTTVDWGPPIMLFQEPPEPGSSPDDLIGRPTRRVSASVVVPL